jgi:hypothetical protein
VYHYSIPYIVFGVMAMFGVVFAAFLPETLNKDLPETVEDSERFGLDQKFWSWNLSDPKAAESADEPQQPAAEKGFRTASYKKTSDSVAALVTSPTASSVSSTTTAEAAAAATSALAVTVTSNPCFTTSDSDDDVPRIDGLRIIKNTYVVHQRCMRTTNRVPKDNELGTNQTNKTCGLIPDDDVTVIESHGRRCPSPNVVMQRQGRMNGLKPDGASVGRVSPHSYSTRV